MWQCWPWTGAKSHSGYGRISLGGSGRTRRVPVTHLAWFLWHGAWPEHLALHHCDNPGCVNPEHLFLGDHADNARDRVAKNRSATGDRNGSRQHPERLRRGSAHPARLNPGYLRRGEQYWSAKLTESMVREIRADSRSSYALAKVYGVGAETIQKARLRKTWAHVR